MKKFLVLIAFLGLVFWIFMQDPGAGGQLVMQFTPAPGADLVSAGSAASTMEAAGRSTAQFVRAAQAGTAETRGSQTAAVDQANTLEVERTDQAKTESALDAQATWDQQIRAWTVTADAQQAASTGTAAVAQATGTAERIATDSQAKADVQQTLDMSQAGLAVEGLEQERIKTEREEWAKYATALTPFIILVALILFTAYKLREDSRLKTAPRGPDGSAPVTILDGQLLTPDLALDPVINPHKPVVRADLILLKLAEDYMKVLAVRGLAQGGRAVSATRLASEVGQSAIIPTSGPVTEETLPEIAPWDSLSSWHGGGLPLGVGLGKSGIVVHPEKTPHLIIAGTSDSGKTMAGLRVLATLALADGWQVVLMNDAAGDFAPLKSHPNLISIRKRGDAGAAVEIARVLEGIAAEMDRRSDLLEQAGVSTWWRMPNAAETLGPRMMVMIDELVALAWSSTGNLSGRIWRAAIKVTSMGRKLGIMFVAATTDPTYRTLSQPGLVVRDNCGRVVFRVRDASSSRAALDADGAERLDPHQFIAQLDHGPVKGVAFLPGDDELRAFLQSRQVPALPEPTWLKLPSGEPVKKDWPAEIIELARKIEGLWLKGSSKRKLAEAADGVYAGAFAGKIDRALEYLAETAEGATTTGSVPDVDATDSTSWK